jgi:biopolymer transport protein ExbB
MVMVDMVEMFQQMGVAAWAVAIVLFIMSFWSIGVAIERIYTYNQARKQSKLYAPQVAKHLKDGRLKEAIALSARRTSATAIWPRSCSRVCRSTSSSRRAAAPASTAKTCSTPCAARFSAHRADRVRPQEGRHSLATIGSTAPFVGLLGTVIGVINAFVGIGATGTGSIGAVSVGIAEALIETALGLFVAIPAVWFYNYLSNRLEYFNVEMDNSSSELVDYFIKKTA